MVLLGSNSKVLRHSKGQPRCPTVLFVRDIRNYVSDLRNMRKSKYPELAADAYMREKGIRFYKRGGYTWKQWAMLLGHQMSLTAL